MNHTYKIIWNRARACWQVVSELAKNTGRIKSVRSSSGGRGAKHLALSLSWLVILSLTSPLIPTVAAFSPPDDTKNTWTFLGEVDGYATWTSTTTDGGNGNLATTLKKYLTAIVVNTGERWRPLDMRTPATASAAVYTTVSDLTLNAGSMLDLAGRQALVYPPSVQYPDGYDNTQNRISGYHFTMDKLTLTGDTVFRINTNVKQRGGSGGLTGASITVRQLDSAGGTVYIQSAYDPAWKELVSGAGGIYERKTLDLDYVDSDNYKNYIAADFSAADYSKVNVVGQASLMDGPLRLYELVPVIDWNNLQAGKAVLVALKAYNTGVISESGKMARDAQLAFRNVWRREEGNLFHRMDELHTRHYRQDTLSPASAGDNPVTENVWAHTYRGKLNNQGAYGRSSSQSYDGLLAGFDKAREGDFYRGTLYYGLLLGRSNAATTYVTGRGDLTGTSLGAYASWTGHNGRYLDLAARMTKIENDYHFYDSDSANTARYDSWASGLSARYGYRRDLANDWYVEPQVGLAIGRIDQVTYTLPNQLTVSQTADRPVVGHLGVAVGKAFSDDRQRGQAYVRLIARHDFGSSKLEARYSGDREALRVAGQDTWLEFSLGARLNTARNSTAFLEVSKSTGGDVRQDWQLNGGLAWRWGLPAKGGKAAVVQPVMAAVPAANSLAAATMTTTAAGSRANAPDEAAALQPEAAPDHNQPADSQATVAASAGTRRSGGPVPVKAAAPASSPLASATLAADADYALAPVTVEAPRPEWERDLSPGTVSVIRPEDFQGEQKTLPDYLETVPGIHIQKVRGTSNYSLARVRGSTAAQVGIYLDGVEMNLTSETGVDLSAIPVDNVARIEVYRGYVPARFAGAPMGGVINIVTKKPRDSGGSVAAGLSSFGGYKGNLEVAAPLGEGSLLLAVNRDQSDGDFSYTNRYHPQTPYGAGPLTAERRTRRDNDYHLTDGLLKWQDENWQVKLAVKDHFRHFPYWSAGNEHSDDPGYINPEPRARLAHPSYQEIRQTDLAVGRRQQAGNLDWGWRLDWRDSEKQWRSGLQEIAHESYYPGQAWSNLRSERYGGVLDAAWKLGNSHLLEFYAGYSREKMDNDLSGLAGYVEGKTSVAAYKWLKYYQIDRWHLQLQDTMQLNRAGTFQLTPVLKLDKLDMTAYKEDGKDAWKYSFGLGAKKALDDHWTVRGSWGTFHHFPNFYEIFGDGGSMQPPPQSFPPPDFEHGLNWDAGVTWQGRALAAQAEVTMTYFSNHTNNLMLLNTTPMGTAFYTNGGDGKASGVELAGQFTWDRWDLQLAATWTRTKILGWGDMYKYMGMPDPDPYKLGSPYPYIPEWEGNARLTYRFPGDRLSLFAEHHYTGKVPISVDSRGYGKWQEAYGLTNLGTRYTIDNQIRLNAGVNDLFNQGSDVVYDVVNSAHSEDGRTIYYPLQGRTYYLTMQYLF